MPGNILDYFARQHASYLHGAGLAGTAHLLHATGLQGQEQLLEIGCGTGASLVLLKKRYPELQLRGGDISPLMRLKAKKRLWFCQLAKKVKVDELPIEGSYPYEEDAFDVIWIESVLAIQETPVLRELLKEINRMLKPGGKLTINETLWLETTPQAKIDEINDLCKRHFGIIQANGDFPYLGNWTALLRQEGFDIRYENRVELHPNGGTERLRPPFASSLFDFIGKIKMKLFYREGANIKKQEGRIIGNDQHLMNAYVMVAKKI